MKAALCLVAVSYSALALVAAQDRSSPPTFDVASVKPSPPDDGTPRVGIWGTVQPGGRWTSSNATLQNIIRAVYAPRPLEEQVLGGPDWVRTTMFDISAKAADAAASRDDLVAMAKTLLADRFRLRLHTEMRELQGYALVRAPSGGRLAPGLRPPAADCAAIRTARARGEAAPPGSARACAVMMRDSGAIVRLDAGGVEMSRLADLLAPRVAAPVVDATGLGGLFDVTLEFTSDVSAQASDIPSIFTAVTEQLGLRLERRRVPTEVLVIDSVELPTPD